MAIGLTLHPTGGYIIDPRKRMEFVVPDLAGFEVKCFFPAPTWPHPPQLKPYVSFKAPLLKTPLASPADFEQAAK